MIIEAAFFALMAKAAHRALTTAKIPPEREAFMHEALSNLDGPTAPDKFRKIAKQFRKWGYKPQATILETRAKWLERTPEEKAEHAAIIAKAMKSTKPAAIRRVADKFEALTATGVARDLRDHADDVENGTYVPPEEKPKSNGHVATHVATSSTKEAQA
jgi:hypothetical protein